MALEITEEVREQIRQADLIFVADEKQPAGPDNREVVFGRQLLHRILAGRAGKMALVVVVPIDFTTDDLERLCAAVHDIKGRHEYQNHEHLN